MNVVTGAHALLDTLVSNGVSVCFANPGTSEMHFVNALDQVDGMRAILCLFEGVATGAADGYHRMSDGVASTLLHLGGGLANGSSNLHNAIKAKSALVNIVGDHSTAHWQRNGDRIPSGMDVLAAAVPYADWTRRAASSATLASDVKATIEAAGSAGSAVATLVVPAECSWGEAELESENKAAFTPPLVTAQETVDRAVDLLRAKPSTTAIILAGRGLRDEGARLAKIIAQATGVTLLAPTFNPRIERGAGRVHVETIPYPVDAAARRLEEFDTLLLFEADPPVSPFAYPAKPLRTHRPDAEILQVVGRTGDSRDALARIAEALDARGEPQVEALKVPEVADGPLDADSVAQVLARVIPQDGIVVDESISVGRQFYAATQNSRPHDWLKNAGGAIGVGHPLALGAAVACPTRTVLSIVGDGSAMYMPQALWTQARERLNVVTIILSNATYAILQGELRNIGASADIRRGDGLLRIDDPRIDFVRLAQSLGLPAEVVDTAHGLVASVERAIAAGGPHLIEARLA